VSVYKSEGIPSYHGTDCPPELCPSCQTLKTGIPSNSELFEPSLNKHLQIKALPRFNDEGELIGLVHVVSDITHKKRLEDALRKMTITDELTGTLNRRGFFTLAEQQLKVAERDKKRTTIFYADLDGFKDINDEYGHEEGDNALIEVSKLLKKIFRESDIIARIGGDEFVIMVGEAHEASIKILTSRIKEHINSYNVNSGKPYHLSLSIGISRYDPEHPCVLEKLLSNADKMMYLNKKNAQIP
jgi:diguanylate cyclase (GGDEF)-like protein